MSAVKILQANVKRLMIEKDMTQKQVGHAGGVSQGSVSNAYRASRGLQLDVVEGIARGLGVSVVSLLSASPGSKIDTDTERLIELYIPLPLESRNQVMRVAEAESRFQEIGAKEI